MKTKFKQKIIQLLIINMVKESRLASIKGSILAYLGIFFSNSRVFPHKNISLPQRIFCESQLIKNLKNLCTSMCQLEQGIIY